MPGNCKSVLGIMRNLRRRERPHIVEIAIRTNERLRLRLVNAAHGRVFALRVDGHRATVMAIDGEPTVRPVMTFVGTFDHRAVDGAPAAGFLQTLKELLEEPGLML